MLSNQSLKSMQVSRKSQSDPAWAVMHMQKTVSDCLPACLGKQPERCCNSSGADRKVYSPRISFSTLLTRDEALLREILPKRPTVCRV